MKRKKVTFSVLTTRLRSLPSLVRRWTIRSLLALLAVQVSIIAALVAVDSWRKRYRAQGYFPHTNPGCVRIGDSEVQIYTYGEDLFAAMLEAIRQARERIVLETFIWKDDAVGLRFKQELQKAADRGISVHVIFDSFANLVVPPGFKRFPPSLHALQYPLFNWLRKPFYFSGYARDHRKILVVDGRIAFIGGYNIGAPYATEWRDTHVRIKGPDAVELESVFNEFWNFNHRRLPALPPTTKRDWDPFIRVHRNDPHMLIFPIRAAYLEAIDRAHHHIYLTHAYFIPDGIVLRALLAAAARGVDVRILLPATSNHVVADWLARGYYAQCLAGGIRLFLYQNAMVHAKTATIDGAWSTIGTANLDRLSLIGNFEVNVEFYDETLAKQMEDIFLHDCTNARELTLEEWKRRSPLSIFAETMLSPLRPLL